MTAKELLKMLNEASDTAEIKVVDGEITITEPKIEYKFKVGDKVVITSVPNNSVYEVIKREISESTGNRIYGLRADDDTFVFAYEENLALYVPKDITERIKTFEDACKWCVENEKREMLHTYGIIFNGLLNSESEITEDVDDILAYLKLRIITAALNEGWGPSTDGCRYVAYFDDGVCGFSITPVNIYMSDSSIKLNFKSAELAEYAAKQFRDIYADFCGRKKGGGQ